MDNKIFSFYLFRPNNKGFFEQVIAQSKEQKQNKNIKNNVVFLWH